MYILALEMACPVNQHCASCIGTLVPYNCRQQLAAGGGSCDRRDGVGCGGALQHVGRGTDRRTDGRMANRRELLGVGRHRRRRRAPTVADRRLIDISSADRERRAADSALRRRGDPENARRRPRRAVPISGRALLNSLIYDTRLGRARTDVTRASSSSRAVRAAR